MKFANKAETQELESEMFGTLFEFIAKEIIFLCEIPGYSA